jgi:hypothetical protein
MAALKILNGSCLVYSEPYFRGEKCERPTLIFPTMKNTAKNGEKTPAQI